jgi:hypothetical protein
MDRRSKQRATKLRRSGKGILFLSTLNGELSLIMPEAYEESPEKQGDVEDKCLSAEEVKDVREAFKYFGFKTADAQVSTRSHPSSPPPPPFVPWRLLFARCGRIVVVVGATTATTSHRSPA